MWLVSLLPGDVILADCSLDIQDSAALFCAEVQFPAFKRGKKQLSASVVPVFQLVKIHMERVIGNAWNKYTILQSMLHLDHLIRKDESGHTTIDKIAFYAVAA